MGSPGLVCSGSLNPNCQRYAVYGEYELDRNPFRKAFAYSVKCRNFSPQEFLCATRTMVVRFLPRTSAFPNLPLNRGFVSCPSNPLRRRKGDLRCRTEACQSFQSALNITTTIQTDSLPPFVRDSAVRAINDCGADFIQILPSKYRVRKIAAITRVYNDFQDGAEVEGDGDGGETSSLEDENTGKEGQIDLQLPRRRLLVEFTCNVCQTRTQRLINPEAYKRGTVYVQCGGCEAYHQLVDNLDLVVEYDFREDTDSDFS